jgi:hypothetical protein
MWRNNGFSISIDGIAYGNSRGMAMAAVCKIIAKKSKSFRKNGCRALKILK